MKLFLLLSLLSTTVMADRLPDQYFIVNGKIAEDKSDAVRALLNDKHASVYKCDAQEITPKATLRKK